MEKRSRLLALLGMVFLLFVLVACGDADGGGSAGAGTGTDTTQEGLFPDRIAALMQSAMPSVDVEPGGILRFARADGQAFPGVLHPIWSNSAPDSNIQDFFIGRFLTIDDDFLIELGEAGRGAVTMEISDDYLSAIFTIREGVYWHDGEPLTARDLEFAYYAKGHPDSTSTRWGQQNEQHIVGGTAFNSGEVDYIEGVTVIDDRTLQVDFVQIVALRETVFPHPLPYHRFADIPFDEMEDHPYVRTEQAIGFGPFMVERIVAGESVTFTRNDNYWDGAPLLDGIEHRVVSPDVIGEELRAGNVDVAHTFAEGAFPYYEDITNVTFLKSGSFVYTYISFTIGLWDHEVADHSLGLDPDATMADVNLRRAMWMAIDNDLVTEVWRGGLRWEASSLVPPVFQWHNPAAQRPAYDIDAANALLDEAGFAFVGDYRAHPDGSPLEINVFGVNRGPVYDTIYHYYLGQWELLGLNITLVATADLTTASNWFAADGTHNDDIDVFLGGAWSTGSNPNMGGLFARDAARNWNRSGYVSERNDQLLEAMGSERAINDIDYRRNAFYEWQEYMIENASIIPTEFRFNFIPVNNRVTNFRIRADHNPIDGWHRVGLTNTDAPFVDGDGQ